MNYRDYLQKYIYVIITPIIKVMIELGFTPNLVTTFGFIGNIIASGFFIMASDKTLPDQGTSLIGWGGALLLFAGLFDMIDGRLARLGNMESKFGALWDSTLDRYSELFSLFGIVVYFLGTEHLWAGVVTFLALVGSIMVSYVRARAEGLKIDCKVGLMQRPERVVVTALCTIITGLTGNIWWTIGGMILIAVLANITAFWRVSYCYNVLKDQ